MINPNCKPQLRLCLHSLNNFITYCCNNSISKATHRNSTSLHATASSAAQAEINASQKGALLRMTGKAEMGFVSFFLESFLHNDFH